MKILIDMDDTIFDTIDAWVDWLNITFDTCVSTNDMTDWDIESVFPTLSGEQVHYPLFVKEFWMGIKPFDGAVECIEKLVEGGHDVYILTASHPDTMSAKSRILLDYMPFLTYKNIIAAYDKSMVKGDIQIDDYIKNLNGDESRRMKILFSRPHNRLVSDDIKDIKRVDNWKEIYELINNIKV